jgi:feruloyl esterase
MIRRQILSLLTLMPLTVLPAAAQRAWAADCSSLIGLTVPGAAITSATDVPAGPFTPPGSSTPITLPAFCRVVATATPTSASLINFEVWMPPADVWNNRFRGEGSGGSAGAIGYSAMAGALRLTYATMANDNGHTGSLWTFAHPPAGDPEKVVDFGHRAEHVTTVAAKAIVQAYYGKPADYSYFVGCSQGGHHGLMEAQRYPADYDGIVAGDPGHFWTHLMMGELWTGAVSTLKGPASDLPQAKLDLVTSAVLEQCEAQDDVSHQFLTNPLGCEFDPASLLCAAGDAPTCLTAAQLQAVQQIYQGPVNPRTGAQIYPGFVRGSENAWRQVLVGQFSGGVPVPGGSSRSFFRDGVFEDPNYNFLSFDFDQDVLFTDTKPAGSGETYASALNAVSPDLDAFKKLGGKLIMYHGFADPFVTPLSTIEYYQSVIAAQRPGKGQGKGEDRVAFKRTQDFARLFMVPGMFHCAGGPGPTRFDVLTPLVQWVEEGVAPDRIIGSHVVGGVTTLTRPLCPYPQEDIYTGEGDPNDATNFVCGVSP